MVCKKCFAPKSLLIRKSGREKKNKKTGYCKALKQKVVRKIKLLKVSVHQIRRKVKKDVTSEQTKKIINLGDSIVKHGSEYNFSHWLKNSKVDVQNFTVTRIKCMQDYVKLFLRENSQHFLFFICENNLATNKKPKQLTNLIIEIALSLKSNSYNVALSNMIISQE